MHFKSKSVYMFCDTFFKIVCVVTREASHICLCRDHTFYMDAGNQCWYIVGLVFMEAAAYWYVITRM